MATKATRVGYTHTTTLGMLVAAVATLGAVRLFSARSKRRNVSLLTKIGSAATALAAASDIVAPHLARASTQRDRLSRWMAR